jgi:mono/diheme cytochrome c family protein
MHHYYTRRIVIALVLFFATLAILFGPLVTALRSDRDPATGAGAESGEGTGSAATVLPDGSLVFNDYCASCHQADKFATRVADSLEPDSTSQGQLEKLIGPPAHGGVSPTEAIAVVLYIRDLAGLPPAFPAGVATPPAAATAAAVAPTPTPVVLETGAPVDRRGAWEQHCATCHRADKFAEGLAAVDDPDLRTRQAITYLAGPPAHRNRPVAAFGPAMNYIREVAGLPPLP